MCGDRDNIENLGEKTPLFDCSNHLITPIYYINYINVYINNINKRLYIYNNIHHGMVRQLEHSNNLCIITY